MQEFARSFQTDAFTHEENALKLVQQWTLKNFSRDRYHGISVSAEESDEREEGDEENGRGGKGR